MYRNMFKRHNRFIVYTNTKQMAKTLRRTAKKNNRIYSRNKNVNA